jgi:sirohydrochlorin cobaltochelatase
MKRYRHYDKELAVVVAGFGSVIEQAMYTELRDDIAAAFPQAHVVLSFSSRMVLKHLDKAGKHYRTLPQTLADLDREGYRRVVVASINLFPTDEHAYLTKTVEGFDLFSPAHFRATRAIWHKTKATSLALKSLDAALSDPNCATLYIIHGVPVLDLGGLASVEYVAAFLEHRSERNYTCSLEGAFPWYAVGDRIIERMRAQGISCVQIVPLLLVSGNHYRKDMVEIQEELARHFETVRIAPSLTRSDRFNLIELESTREIIIENIREEVAKFGC